MKYQVKLVCLVNTLLQEPHKMAHVKPNLQQFLGASLTEPYTKPLKDLTGTMSLIEQDPSETVASECVRAHLNHSLQIGPISNSLHHQII